MCAALGGSPSRTGVPYGADMRLFTARGIPTVMLGTTGLERAHSTDEWVSVEELERLRDVIARALGGRS